MVEGRRFIALALRRFSKLLFAFPKNMAKMQEKFIYNQVWVTQNSTCPCQGDQVARSAVGQTSCKLKGEHDDD
jgi:hypothetical protein